ncbi:VAV protein, partial [Glaucidium brasilianum]|nr:VAV protein [Glaucidium brasilianum]
TGWGWVNGDMSMEMAKGWVEVGPWDSQGGTHGTWTAMGHDLCDSSMSLSPPIPTPCPGAVRSFGSAKARYDFCARDRTELTLREGDIIRVLSKKGHPGWWKGEIYGRVGWFPANYVEEDYSEYC